MSMIGNLLRVTNEELESYLEDSSLLENRIYNDGEDGEDANLTDIDKSWNGILYLLTGQDLENLNHPMGRVLFSNQNIDDDQDLGYGPGQYLTPAQVKEVNEQLSRITEEEFKKRFDADKMMELEIYPTVWKEEGIIDYLFDNFKGVQNVYATAAKNNEAIITFIN